MRNWITFLMTLLVGSTSYANAIGNVSLELGYRQDSISWKNYASDDSAARVEFKDLDIFQIGICGRSNLGCNFYGRASGYWGWVLDGKFHEKFEVADNDYSYSYSDYSDYGFNGGSNDTFTVTEFSDVVDDRYVFGANVAIGYPFYFCDCSMALAPVVGYAFDEQNLRLNRKGALNGGDDYGYDYDYSTVGGCNGGCCDNKFINRWYGPFVGVDFAYRPCNECWSVYSELEYHFGRFKGRRHEEIGSGNDFYAQRARHVDGWVFNIGADYDFCNCWTAGLAVKFQDWSAHNNHHRHYGDSFSGNGDFHERNKHRWHSYAVNLTVGHEF